MLKRCAVFAAAMVMGGVLAVSGPSEAAKGFRNLSFMGGYMERHPTVVNVWKPWFKQAEERFGGKLSFDYFVENQLYPVSEGLAALRKSRSAPYVLRHQHGR